MRSKRGRLSVGRVCSAPKSHEIIVNFIAELPASLRVREYLVYRVTYRLELGSLQGQPPLRGG